MQAAPPVTVELRCGRAWLAAWAVWLALTVGVSGAWAIARGEPSSLAVAGLVALAAAALFARSCRPRRWQLAWDGHGAWTLADGSAGVVAPAGAVTGAVTVTVDLGSALMLRFDALPVRRSGLRAPRRVWLPIERRDLPQHWHALRCALYSPPVGAGAAETGR